MKVRGRLRSVSPSRVLIFDLAGVFLEFQDVGDRIDMALIGSVHGTVRCGMLIPVANISRFPGFRSPNSFVRWVFLRMRGMQTSLTSVIKPPFSWTLPRSVGFPLALWFEFEADTDPSRLLPLASGYLLGLARRRIVEGATRNHTI
jgi:hypothetical protein